METDYEIIESSNDECELSVTGNEETTEQVSVDGVTTAADCEGDTKQHFSMHFIPRIEPGDSDTGTLSETPTTNNSDVKQLIVTMSDESKMEILVTNLRHTIDAILNMDKTKYIPASITLFERITEELESHYEQYFGKYKDIPVITNHVQNNMPVYSLLDIVKSINPNIRMSQQVITQLNHEIININTNAKNKFEFVYHSFDNDYFYIPLGIEPEYKQISQYFALYQFISAWLIDNPSFLVIV